AIWSVQPVVPFFGRYRLAFVHDSSVHLSTLRRRHRYPLHLWNTDSDCWPRFFCVSATIGPMFKSPEKKVQEYVARVNPAVMTSFRSDTPLGPSALVVGLSPECGVAARIIDGFWHTRMIRP